MNSIKDKLQIVKVFKFILGRSPGQAEKACPPPSLFPMEVFKHKTAVYSEGIYSISMSEGIYSISISEGIYELSRWLSQKLIWVN